MVTVEADSYEEGRQRLKRLEKRCSAKVTSGYAEPSKNRKPRKRRVEMHYGRREWHNTQQGCASKIGSASPQLHALVLQAVVFFHKFFGA